MVISYTKASQEDMKEIVFLTYDISCFPLLLNETATEGLNDIYELRS